ncbi:serine hydrolase domain-containing protein [Geojedonia litorea]|uniref:Serine hydrolase domain-containing protein n=1 Tax=Geojedonia litorea TaxID=1268269 RepID=A0ABV9N5V7_9FLAO
MKTLVFYLSISIIAFQYIGAQSETKNYNEAYKLIEVWLDAQKDFDNLPGISAIVVKDQEVLWTGAFGYSNIEDQVSATSETLCSICSISKLFTSVAIMKLYDEGKLRLDDRIEDVLPWYNLKQQYATSGPITIRSLLTHSSGLPRQADVPYWTGPDFPFPKLEEVKSKLATQETLYPASTYWQYSNLALSLLGNIIEEISGVSYDEYVNEHILKPLRLKDTRTHLPKDLYGKQLAYGYSAVDRTKERSKVNFFEANNVTAAAGFSSNVLDLGRFASWQFRLLDAQDTEILKPSTLKNMHNVHWTDEDFGLTWGLGFSVYKGSDGSKWVGHGGSCPGYRSTLQLNPKTKMAYAAMINAGGTNPNRYTNGIHEILNKVETVKKEENTKVNLTDYTGYYSSQPWWSENYISEWNGKLVSVGLPSDNPAEAMTFYKHIEGDTFKRVRDNGELGEALQFVRGDKGEVIKMKSHQNYSTKIKK